MRLSIIALATVTLVAAVLVHVVPIAPKAALGQTGDITGDVLSVRDSVDLLVLRNILASPEVHSTASDKLATGDLVSLGFALESASGLTREYECTLEFREGDMASSLKVFYEHDATAGMPSLPPDECTVSWAESGVDTSTYRAAVSDLAAYDFLIHVLTEHSGWIDRWLRMRRAAICDIRAETVTNGKGQVFDYVHLFLCRDGRAGRWVTFYAADLGGGTYGPVEVLR